MIQDWEDIVPLAEEEVAKLIDKRIDIGWATNNAKFISQILHKDLAEAINPCEEEEEEETRTKRDEDKTKEKDHNISGEGAAGRDDVTKIG